MTDRRFLGVLSAALVCTLLSALLWAGTIKPPNIFNGDTPGFLKPAYNLVAHQVYSHKSDTSANPSGAREPGYPWFLAALMLLDPSFGSFTNDCLEEAQRCPDEIYRTAQLANGALIALSGFALFLAAWNLTGRPLPAFTAGALIWLNGELADGRHALMSDYLALFALAATMAAAAWACKSGRTWHWALTGVLLASVALTKAIYLYFFLAAAALCLLGLATVGPFRRRLLTGLLGLSLAFAIAAGGWMTRNAWTTEQFTIATDDRAGIALSVRHEYNRMTPRQYAAAFIHWTRGFGDKLARQVFGPDVMSDFGFEDPEGFVYRGHLYSTRVREAMARDSVSQEQAEAVLNSELISAILQDLPVHALTTLPLLYRGLWIDEFVVFTFPALIWLTWVAWRRRHWPILIVLSGGWFSLLFYPLISLNITRYQITTVPALALAGGIAAAALHDWIRGRMATRRRSIDTSN